MSEEQCGKNTDTELFREDVGDYYSPSLHVTQSKAIGINVGGNVIVKSLKTWHGLVAELATKEQRIKLLEAEIAEAKKIQGYNTLSEARREMLTQTARAEKAEQELAAQAEVSRVYREALEWYSNMDNYSQDKTESQLENRVIDATSAIMRDMGHLAHCALLTTAPKGEKE